MIGKNLGGFYVCVYIEVINLNSSFVDGKQKLWSN